MKPSGGFKVLTTPPRQSFNPIHDCAVPVLSGMPLYSVMANQKGKAQAWHFNRSRDNVKRWRNTYTPPSNSYKDLATFATRWTTAELNEVRVLQQKHHIEKREATPSQRKSANANTALQSITASATTQNQRDQSGRETRIQSTVTPVLELDDFFLNSPRKSK